MKGSQRTDLLFTSKGKHWRSTLPLLSIQLALVVTLCFGAGQVTADIFLWVDSGGVRHFSNVKQTGAVLFARSYRAPDSDAIAVMATDTSPERFTRYDLFITEACSRYLVPELLVRAVIKAESDYDPRVISHAGARGLMQLMPQTAKRMGITDAFDPQSNIMAGTRYLRLLLDLFNQDMTLAVAAYNSGESSVQKYNGIPPFSETRHYVKKVMRFYDLYRSDAASG